MKKIFFTILIMTIFISGFCINNIDEYILEIYKSAYKQADFNKIEVLQNTIIKEDPEIFVDYCEKLTLLELSYLKPVIEIMEEKIINSVDYNESSLTGLNNIKTLIKDTQPEYNVKALYFADSDNIKIEFEKDSSSPSNQQIIDGDKEMKPDHPLFIRYPIIEDELNIIAEVETSDNEFPVTLSTEIFGEKIEKLFVLNNFTDKNNIREFTGKIKITDIYEKWPGFNNNNKHDKVSEYAVFNCILPKQYTNDILSPKVADLFESRLGLFPTSTFTAYGDYKKDRPDANERSVKCGGGNNIYLYSGGELFHKTNIKNTADWIYLNAHGSHTTGALAVEIRNYGFSDYIHEQIINTLPNPDLSLWENEVKNVILNSCAVLDINDYNKNYPYEKNASPGIKWSLMKGVNFFGYNSEAYMKNSTNIIENFLYYSNDNDLYLDLCSTWMSGGDIDRNICVITKDNDYYYWKRTGFLDLPLYTFELDHKTEEEWNSDYNDFRGEKSISPIDIEVLFNKFNNRKLNINEKVKLIFNVYNSLRLQSNYKSFDFIDKINVRDNTEKDILEAFALSMPRIIEEYSNKFNFDSNYERSLQIIDKIISENNKFSKPLLMIKALIIGQNDENLQKRFYEEIIQKYPELKELAQIGLLCSYFNASEIDRCIEYAEFLLNNNNNFKSGINTIIEKCKNYYKSENKVIKSALKKINSRKEDRI